MVVLRDIFILKIFRWGAEARSSDEMRVVSEILPKWCQKNNHFFSAESLEVVLREESWEKITSVRKRLSAWWSSGARKVEKKSQVSENDQVLGGRLARDSPGTCDFSAKCWWSSRATFTWDLWFFGQVSENLKKYKGRGLLDETSLVGLCLFYLMSCISVFSRFTFLHRYNYVFVFKILPGYGRIRVRPHEVWSGEAGFYCVFELISSNPDSVVSSSSRFFV